MKDLSFNQNLPINEILQGDCLDLFKKIPSNSIDCVFADPPFNLKKKYNSYKDKLATQEYLEWCKEWINECVRVLKLCNQHIMESYFIQKEILKIDSKKFAIRTKEIEKAF